MGELAKYYFPGGHDIKTLDIQESLDETNELLKKTDVIIYEAAIKYKDCFIRVDILKKEGNRIELHEVKAKSADLSGVDGFYNTKGIISGWRPYLEDIAFQKYVAQKAFPEYEFEGFLMLADKNSKTSIDGLNQKFIAYQNENNRTEVRVSGGVSPEDMGDKILTSINVDDIITDLHAEKYELGDNKYNYPDYIDQLSRICVKQINYDFFDIGSKCKGCEFKTNGTGLAKGLRSGFKECWIRKTNLSPTELDEPMVFDIWNYRKSQDRIDEQRYLISQIDIKDFNVKPEDISGELKTKERQALQIIKTRNNDNETYLDVKGLREEHETWKYPLHMIDFETSAVAIPFTSGRSPYEQIAFQFSHHIIYEDGRIKHAGEYLNNKQGEFPNFEFLRNLKEQLSKDEGTIFRYAAHENSVLNAIYKQLYESTTDEVPDRQELMSFIQSITHTTKNSDFEWHGNRDMVDMLDLVKKHYYHLSMKGSNSIKVVLPAVLNTSDFIKSKYSKPVYGTQQIPSLNFKDHTWVQYDENGNVKDPYKLLPPVFDREQDENLNKYLVNTDNIADGGAAMTAYAKMQFTRMSNYEREKVSSALLKYCELDTWAMVAVMEYWLNEIRE